MLQETEGCSGRLGDARGGLGTLWEAEGRSGGLNDASGDRGTLKGSVSTAFAV